MSVFRTPKELQNNLECKKKNPNGWFRFFEVLSKSLYFSKFSVEIPVMSIPSRFPSLTKTRLRFSMYACKRASDKKLQANPIRSLTDIPTSFCGEREKKKDSLNQ